MASRKVPKKLKTELTENEKSLLTIHSLTLNERRADAKSAEAEAKGAREEIAKILSTLSPKARKVDIHLDGSEATHRVQLVPRTTTTYDLEGLVDRLKKEGMSSDDLEAFLNDVTTRVIDTKRLEAYLLDSEDPIVNLAIEDSREVKPGTPTVRLDEVKPGDEETE